MTPAPVTKLERNVPSIVSGIPEWKWELMVPTLFSADESASVIAMK